jgi:hypothetical protein
MKIPKQNQSNNNLPEDNEEAIEIDNSGPSIASLKNNKLIIIVASALLITVVLYFFFFRGKSQEGQEKIEEVLPDINAQVSPNDSGKSFFEFEKSAEKKDVKDPEILKNQ